METSILLQLAQVKHFVKAGVFVGDDIKDNMTIFLISVHVMVNNGGSSEVFCFYFLASLSVYQVDQRLVRETKIELKSPKHCSSHSPAPTMNPILTSTSY